MPRKQLSLSVALQKDPTWLGLSMGAQWLYVTIACDSFTDAAGICPLLPRRWSNQAAGISANDVVESLVELEHGDRAIVDRQEEYLILPKLLADTGAERQPNVIRGAIKAASTPHYPVALREAFAQVIADMDPDGPAVTMALGGKRSSRKAISPAVRLAVYERDGWTCQSCKRLILPTEPEHRRGLSAPFDETGWLELDHVRPVIHGGGDDVENLQALCSPCNRTKGARLLLGLDGC